MTRLGNDVTLGEKEWHLPLAILKIGLGKLETFLLLRGKSPSLSFMMSLISIEIR